MNEYIVLIGGGGHCKSCIDVIEQEGRFLIAGIVDIKEKANDNILGYPVIGTDDDIEDIVNRHKNILITLGQIKTAGRRVSLYEIAKNCRAVFPAVVAPSANMSRHAIVNEGTILMHHTVVNAGAIVGRNCIINTKATVEHDVRIGDHSHISTASVINGGCEIGRQVFIGSNAVIVNHVRVCDFAVIGAGAVVVEDISEPGIYVGVPARRIHNAVEVN